jgi:hypothetical protein
MPSRAGNAIKQNNLEPSGKKQLSFLSLPIFQKVLICMDLPAVPIHQLGRVEEAKFIIQVLPSTLFPSIQPYCDSVALLKKFK